MALTKIKAAGLTADLIDETKLADNSIDSEHYNDGSIDNAHLADDAVGIAELSATGTASSSTFLRGDNSWVTPTDTNTQLSTEEVQDIVGAMFTGNTETNITATYEDSDGTIDLVSTDTVIGGATGVDFNDNVKIRLGTGNDLEIYHDETDDVIHSTGTSLRTRSNIFRANNASNDAVLFRANASGNFEAFFDGSKKLETTSSGIGVTGTVASVSTNDLKLSTASAGADMQFQLNGTTVMTLQNTSKLEVNDNFEMVWGNGSDLIIKHDGDSSYIEHVTSGTDLVIDAKSPGDDLILRAADNVDIRTQGNEAAITCIGDGAVELYHDGTKKFETTADGINAYTGSGTGAATGFGLQVFGGTSARTAPAIYLSGGAGNTDNSSIFSKFNLTLGCNQPTNIADRFVEFTNGNNRMGGFGTAGLTFGSDTADANALSDYEEGTWTPALTNGPTLTSAKGYYTKIGRVVNAAFYFNTSNDGSAAHVRINNLPFTSASDNTSGYNGVGAGGIAWDYGTSSVRRGHIPANATLLYFYNNTGGAMEGSSSDFESKEWRATAIYITD